MRTKAVLAVTVVSVVGLVGVAPMASAAPAVPATSAQELGGRAPQAAPGDCRSVGVVGERTFKMSCRKSAPGKKFRVVIDCTNSGWLYGEWKVQTNNYKYWSERSCPKGGILEAVSLQTK